MAEHKTTLTDKEKARLVGFYKDAVDDILSAIDSTVWKNPSNSRLTALLEETRSILKGLDAKAVGYVDRKVKQLYSGNIYFVNDQIRSKVSIPRPTVATKIHQEAIKRLLLDPTTGITPRLKAASASVGKSVESFVKSSRVMSKQAGGLAEAVAQGILLGRSESATRDAILNAMEGKRPATIMGLKRAGGAADLLNAPYLEIPLKSGGVRRMHIFDYAQMTAATMENRVRTEALKAEMLSAEIRLAQVSPHPPLTDCACALFAGRIVALDAETAKVSGYPFVGDLPGGGPPFHPYCTHTLLPWIPELESDDEIRLAHATDLKMKTHGDKGIPKNVIGKDWSTVSKFNSSKGGIGFAVDQNPALKTQNAAAMADAVVKKATSRKAKRPKAYKLPPLPPPSIAPKAVKVIVADDIVGKVVKDEEVKKTTKKKTTKKKTAKKKTAKKTAKKTTKKSVALIGEMPPEQPAVAYSQEELTAALRPKKGSDGLYRIDVDWDRVKKTKVRDSTVSPLLTLIHMVENGALLQDDVRTGEKQLNQKNFQSLEESVTAFWKQFNDPKVLDKLREWLGYKASDFPDGFTWEHVDASRLDWNGALAFFAHPSQMLPLGAVPLSTTPLSLLHGMERSINADADRIRKTTAYKRLFADDVGDYNDEVNSVKGVAGPFNKQRWKDELEKKFNKQKERIQRLQRYGFVDAGVGTDELKPVESFDDYWNADGGMEAELDRVARILVVLEKKGLLDKKALRFLTDRISYEFMNFFDDDGGLSRAYARPETNFVALSPLEVHPHERNVILHELMHIVQERSNRLNQKAWEILIRRAMQRGFRITEKDVGGGEYETYIANFDSRNADRFDYAGRLYGDLPGVFERLAKAARTRKLTKSMVESELASYVTTRYPMEVLTMTMEMMFDFSMNSIKGWGQNKGLAQHLSTLMDESELFSEMYNTLVGITDDEMIMPDRDALPTDQFDDGSSTMNQWNLPPKSFDQVWGWFDGFFDEDGKWIDERKRSQSEEFVRETIGVGMVWVGPKDRLKNYGPNSRLTELDEAMADGSSPYDEE